MNERWQELLRLALPQRCPLCGEQLGRAAGLCSPCRARLEPQLSAESTVWRERTPHLVSLGRYRGGLAHAVRSLKYRSARDLAGPLGAALAAGVPAAWGVQAVTFVPMPPGRQRERGHNQAELLAQAVAAGLGLSCLPLLERLDRGARHARLRAWERERAALQVRARVVPPARVLLVDDVLTGGGTLRACVRALQNEGAEAVYLAVVAR